MKSTPDLVTPELVAALAALADLDLPPESLEGVMANLRTLLDHSERLFAFPLSEDREPAFDYRP